MNNIRWSDSEDLVIRDNSGKLSAKEIGDLLSRSAGSVYCRASRLGVSLNIRNKDKFLSSDDRKLVVGLLHAGVCLHDTCIKMESPVECIRKARNEEKSRIRSKFDIVTDFKNIDYSISEPSGVTRRGLVTHVIMDLAHYQELTK